MNAKSKSYYENKQEEKIKKEICTSNIINTVPIRIVHLILSLIIITLYYKDKIINNYLATNAIYNSKIIFSNNISDLDYNSCTKLIIINDIDNTETTSIEIKQVLALLKLRYILIVLISFLLFLESHISLTLIAFNSIIFIFSSICIKGMINLNANVSINDDYNNIRINSDDVITNYDSKNSNNNENLYFSINKFNYMLFIFANLSLIVLSLYVNNINQVKKQKKAKKSNLNN